MTCHQRVANGKLGNGLTTARKAVGETTLTPGTSNIGITYFRFLNESTILTQVRETRSSSGHAVTSPFGKGWLKNG